MNLDTHVQETEQATRWWWVFLITGILWLIIALIILRFNLNSVALVGVLIGVVILIAGVNEFVIMAVTSGGWKWVHLVLGILFVIFGLIALFNPFATFGAIAAVMGWVFLFLGTFDIVLSFMSRRENDLWWLRLIAGIILIGLAYWTAGSFIRGAYLLIIAAGVWSLIRGITEIILAFEIHSARKRLQAGAAAPEAAAAASAAAPPPTPPPSAPQQSAPPA